MIPVVHKNDAIIQRKIDRGVWRPSLDTGHVYSTEIHRNLKEKIGNSGYCFIGKGEIHVARVIWIAAHGIPDAGMEVDHINGNRTDNRLENLQLVTVSENRMRALAALTFDDAENIRKAHAAGQNKSYLARQYAVSMPTIQRIINHETYKSRPPHERLAEIAAHQIAALDSETIAEICAEHRSGASIRQIAGRRRLTVTAVRAIVRGFHGGEA